MSITFRYKGNGGDYAVFDGDERVIGTLRWGTGSAAGWYFVRHTAGQSVDDASGTKVCDLNVDTETVLRKCRDMATQQTHEMHVGPPEMPHQNAVAALLYWSWHGIGFSCDWPIWAHLTNTERACITEQQMQAVAEWIADRVQVWVIRSPSGEVLCGGGKRDKRGLRSVLHWQMRDEAEHSLKTQCGNAGYVEEIPVRILLELCRA